MSGSLNFVANSVTGDSSGSVDFDVPFPSDYSELLEQVSSTLHLYSIIDMSIAGPLSIFQLTGKRSNGVGFKE